MTKHYASCDRNDWLTPDRVLYVVKEFRDIDLDPCAAVGVGNQFATYNISGNGTWNLPYGHYRSEPRLCGLRADWARCVQGGGLVYVNPPYGGRKKIIDEWIKKCAFEAERGVEIVGLVPASTGSQWFKTIWNTITSLCFVEGRLRFEVPNVRGSAPQQRLFDADEDIVSDVDGSATFWSAIPYWGPSPERFLQTFCELGQIVCPPFGRLYPRAPAPKEFHDERAGEAMDAV